MSKQIDQALTDKMVEKALQVCAAKHFDGDGAMVLKALHRGYGDAYMCLADSLIAQMSAYLGQMDQMVNAVFEYEPEYATIHPHAHISAGHFRKRGLNLIIWVKRKSAALKALVATLEQAFAESQSKAGLEDENNPLFSLDIKLVDDQDVDEKRGYGMIVSSQLVRATQVWIREGVDRRFTLQPLPSNVQVGQERPISFDLEFAPASRIIEQALEIEKIPADSRKPFDHYLTDLKVALIRRLISDQLAYIDVAKQWFTVSDLADIFHRRIGYGRIGGKSAGMLLAARILQEAADAELLERINIPKSYFLGSDLIYIFMAMNGLMHWNNQKYKSEELMREEFPQIQAEFKVGSFPPEVMSELQAVLENLGPQPLIVRSSSQLEDNFGTSFAGKYDSYFCPNQGTTEMNLKSLAEAVALTYASTLKPEALIYRRSKGLQDYDERMAVLIQAVQGDKFGKYYFPFGAGAAFSRNIYRWSPDIRRRDGFARLVWGLGTRAVERVGDDYPRPVALSHPTLLPDDSPEAIRKYSQHYIDLINLEQNSIQTLPVHEVLTPRYPGLNLLTELDREGYFSTPRMMVSPNDIPKLAVTFSELLRRTSFAASLSEMLRLLEQHYHGAVDIEFTVQIPDHRVTNPDVKISLLQCRPQSYLQSDQYVSIPDDLSQENTIFSTHFIVPQGYLNNIRYVLFVKPEAYFALPNASQRSELTLVISHINAALEEKSFICVGPGRWGATNLELGVFVGYGDIYNAGALVELSGQGIGPAPEPSLGTHFFQDLMEAQIYPLAIQMDDERTIFKQSFFYNTPNCLTDWISASADQSNCIQLIDVSKYKPRHHLEIVMNDEQGRAVAYIARDHEGEPSGTDYQ
jgi:hypothetical protein